MFGCGDRPPNSPARVSGPGRDRDRSNKSPKIPAETINGVLAWTKTNWRGLPLSLSDSSSSCTRISLNCCGTYGDKKRFYWDRTMSLPKPIE